MTHENQAVCGKAVADAWVYVFVSQQPALGTLRRDTTKSDMESRCQNILVYTSALEICVMVLVLSREAPLRVKVYFQCAYFYSLYLDRETKMKPNVLFTAIRKCFTPLWWCDLEFNSCICMFFYQQSVQINHSSKYTRICGTL